MDLVHSTKKKSLPKNFFSPTENIFYTYPKIIENFPHPPEKKQLSTQRKSFLYLCKKNIFQMKNLFTPAVF